MKVLNGLNKILPYLVILSVLVINLSLYFTHKMSNLIFNDDALYLPALYKDIVINGGLYSSWALTPAPYFFPDMSLYFLANFVTQNFYYAIPLFFILESLLLLFIIYKIYTLFFDKATPFSIASIIFGLLYLIPTVASSFQYVSAFHYGEFVIGLLVVYLVLLILNSKSAKPFHYFFILLFSSLTIASDELFVLHFILPSVAALFILWSIRGIDTKKLLIFIATFGFSVWLGELIHNLFVINENAQNIKLNADSFPVNVSNIENIFLHSYQHLTTSTLIILVTLFLAIFTFVMKSRLSFFYDSYRNSSKFVFISLFLVFMELGSLTVLSLSSVPLVANRYMIPLFIVPIVMLPIYFDFFKLLNYKKFNNIMMNAILSILLIALFVDARKRLMHSKFYSEYYPPFQECIDDFLGETGSKYGIGEYWQSKSIYILSKYDPEIAQVYYDLKPRGWITTDSWNRDKYDFALIHYNTNRDRFSPDKDRITFINGDPDKTITCDDTDILYYKNGMYTKPFAYVGSTQTWKASELPSVTGEKKDSTIIVIHGSKKGVITFGPYAILPAGKYRFNIAYNSSEAEPVVVGSWDVAVTLKGNAKQIKAGTLMGTNSKDVSIGQVFTIPQEIANNSIEIRTFYNGTGNITIKSLALTKVKQ